MIRVPHAGTKELYCHFATICLAVAVAKLVYIRSSNSRQAAAGSHRTSYCSYMRWSWVASCTVPWVCVNALGDSPLIPCQHHCNRATLQAQDFEREQTLHCRQQAPVEDSGHTLHVEPLRTSNTKNAQRHRVRSPLDLVLCEYRCQH